MSLDVYTPNEVIVGDMREARKATERCKRGASDLWEGLADLVKIRGWRHLGYDTFQQWAVAELAIAESTAYQYLTKTTMLIELAQSSGLPVSEVEPSLPLRHAIRRKPQDTLLLAMRSAIKQLDEMPILIDPSYVTVATQLREAIAKALQRTNRVA